MPTAPRLLALAPSIVTAIVCLVMDPANPHPSRSTGLPAGVFGGGDPAAHASLCAAAYDFSAPGLRALGVDTLAAAARGAIRRYPTTWERLAAAARIEQDGSARRQRRHAGKQAAAAGAEDAEEEAEKEEDGPATLVRAWTKPLELLVSWS